MDAILARLIDSGSGPFGALLVSPNWANALETPDAYRVLPLTEVAASRSHLYLRVPSDQLQSGMRMMYSWGFDYKTNLVWLQADPETGRDPEDPEVESRDLLELVLFGVRGRLRTLAPGRRQVNLFSAPRTPHAPDELYEIIEACSPGPYCELWSGRSRPGWTQWEPFLTSSRRC